MAEKKTSQAHNDTLPWQRAADESAEHMGAFLGQLEQLEVETAERAAESVDEIARLMKEGIDYQMRLATEWRRMTQRSMDLMRTRKD